MTHHMSTIVEATSLSSVTSIAFNPPPHPSDPSELPQLPLVLYIARVPGSRDVFLTPIKPREKVVTAEDVQSSLYFVHVNGDGDLGDLPKDHVSSANTDASQLVPIQQRDIRRKPALPKRTAAPLTPPYTAEDEDMPELQRRLPTSQKPKCIARKPLRSDADNAVAQTGLSVPIPARRPLPSPPRDEEPFEPYDRSLHASHMHLLRHFDHRDGANPYSWENESSEIPIDPAELPQPESLTLIRRDPSSNEQWNVASVHDPPIYEVSSAALRNPSAAKRTKRGGGPVYLDISNPAYAQFIDTDRAGSRISTAFSNSSNSDQPPEGTFRRRLYMPGSQYGEHAYSHASLPSSGFEPSEGGATRRTIRSSADMSANSSALPAVDDRRGKGYTFTSPWDGRCEFATGSTGKSLKCRQILPHHQQANSRYNDAVVSELRFNLPTSSKTATVVKESRSSYIRGMHRQSSSEDGMHAKEEGHVLKYDEKMDLTLGQERAGGGFGGKQAKLGKLIIEPEGLKMLDLLVAANLALWWRAYERY